MKIWLDTEFIDEPPHLQLISIGMVTEDGRELYLESSEVDWKLAGPWVLQNVKPHLRPADVAMPRRAMALVIKEFIGAEKPEFWGYYSAYDWVLFCQLFGPMVQMPKGWPQFCQDMRQEMVGMTSRLDLAPFQRGPEQRHHALEDARWTKDCWYFLQGMKATSAAETVRELLAEMEAEARAKR